MIVRKIHEKSSQKPPQILAKSSRNRKKTEKNREKNHDGLRMRKQKYETNARKAEKVRQIAQKGPEGGRIIWGGGLHVGLPGLLNVHSKS